MGSGLDSPSCRFPHAPAFSLPEAFRRSTELAEKLAARRFQGQTTCPSCSLSLSCADAGLHSACWILNTGACWEYSFSHHVADCFVTFYLPIRCLLTFSSLTRLTCLQGRREKDREGSSWYFDSHVKDSWKPSLAGSSFSDLSSPLQVSDYAHKRGQDPVAAGCRLPGCTMGRAA